MKRWNLSKIVIYSHHGHRRIVEFRPGEVNIITGKSNTGKSALTEIVDYVMGSGKCHVPYHVRDRASWFGLLWTAQGTEFFICRRSPHGNDRPPLDSFFEIGTKIDIPLTSDLLRRVTDIRSAIAQFERLVGIPDIKIVVPGTRSPEKISFRHILPFLLQDDSTIIDKSRIFWIGDDKNRDEKRAALISRLPFFLGAVTPETVALEGELARARRELRFAEKAKRERDAITGRATSRALGLQAEARAVGLVSTAEINQTLEDVLETLRVAVKWTPGSNPALLNEDATFKELNRNKSEVEKELSRLRVRLRTFEELSGASGDFTEASKRQLDRLTAVNIIPEMNGDPVCPVCSHSLDSTAHQVQQMLSVYSRMERELADVQKQRPQLVQAAEQTKEQIGRLEELLFGIRSQIKSIVKENDRAADDYETEQRRIRTVGRLSLFLDSYSGDQGTPDSENTLAALEERVAYLSSMVDSTAKREAMEQKRMLISGEATEILRELPFDKGYHSYRVDLNPSDLEVGLLTPRGKETMRNIGSDENYLTLHFSIVFGLQRIFRQIGSPVPGLVILDQPSRPYFPQDLEDEVEIEEQDHERQSLRSYFDFLFKETAREDGLQVIVLEHAYFKDDPRYVKATKERWIPGHEFLIPSSWPSIYELE